MKNLYDAIFVKYAASDVPNTLTKLYNTEADEDAEFPYAVLQVVSGAADDFASGEHYTENWLIQFNLFERGPNMTLLLTALAALVTAFDSCTLAVSGYQFLSCRRVNILQTKVEGVWQINVSFRIKLRSS